MEDDVIAKGLGISTESYREAVEEQLALEKLDVFLNKCGVKYYTDDERVIIQFKEEDIKINGFKNALKFAEQKLKH